MNCKLLTVTGVGVNSLEETEDDPCVDSNNVEVTTDSTVEDGASEGTGSENEDLSRVGVFGSKTEGSGVLVVDLVNVLVEGAPVERAVGEEVEHVLEDEEERDLGSLVLPRREGDLPGGHAEELSHGVEEPDLQIQTRLAGDASGWEERRHAPRAARP